MGPKADDTADTKSGKGAHAPLVAGEEACSKIDAVAQSCFANVQGSLAS